MSAATKNIELAKPDIEDFYDISVQNTNMDKIDTEIGEIKNPGYQMPDSTEELVSGESIFTAFGKLSKAIGDFIIHKTLAASDAVAGHVKLAYHEDVTEPGTYALDAVQANSMVQGTLAHQISGIKSLLTPIGYIFAWEPIAGSNVDLSTPQKVHGYYGFGVWEQLKDRFLIGAGGGYEISSTGGEAQHALTAGEMPSHGHPYSGNTAGNNVDHVHSGNTGTVSIDHSHSGSTTYCGDHVHGVYVKNDNTTGSDKWRISNAGAQAGAYGDAVLPAGNHNHTFGTSGIDANHTHGFTTGGQNTGHSHPFSGNTSTAGSGAAHNNMPPYRAVYIWKRIA